MLLLFSFFLSKRNKKTFFSFQETLGQIRGGKKQEETLSVEGRKLGKSLVVREYWKVEEIIKELGRVWWNVACFLTRKSGATPPKGKLGLF